jgi:small subunit ribosomal protein S17
MHGMKEVHPKKLRGVVVSDRMAKTAVVLVTRLTKYPVYKKYYKVSKKFKAHDEENAYKTGDTVVIQETRPLSKDKRWVIVAKA